MTQDLMKYLGEQILEDEGAMIIARDQGDWNRFHRLEGHKSAMLKVRQKIVELDNSAATKDLDRTVIARDAILNELKRRYKEGDQAVKATTPDHRWCVPQLNYFVGSGNMECPICKTGVLAYSRSAYNGHVHASCNTQDCVWWKE